MFKYILGLCVLLLVGCASVQGAFRVAKFDEVSSTYEKAIRWKRYDVAKGFIKGREPEHKEPTLEALNKIRVTSYKVLNRGISEDNLRVEQTVRIAYHSTDQPTERSLVDTQLWEYDETQETWYLESGLPDFR